VVVGKKGATYSTASRFFAFATDIYIFIFFPFHDYDLQSFYLPNIGKS
jgi:hypothetical protein